MYKLYNNLADTTSSFVLKPSHLSQCCTQKNTGGLGMRLTKNVCTYLLILHLLLQAVETIEYLEKQLSQEHQLRKAADSYLLKLQTARQRTVGSLEALKDSQHNVSKHCKSVRYVWTVYVKLCTCMTLYRSVCSRMCTHWQY